MSGSDALDSAIIRFIQQEDPVPSEEEFSALAARLFEYQFDNNPLYRRFCEGRGCRPDGIGRWEDMPAVPTDAFKMADFCCFSPERRIRTFVSSGTTQHSRSRHHLDTLALYEASLTPNFARHLLPDGAALPMLSLSPPGQDRPESSLFHMIDSVMRRYGAPGSGHFLAPDGSFHAGRLAVALQALTESGKPVMLLGAAFSFVHFLDWCEREGRRFQLPAGSRLMETGGYKGRSREMPRDALTALIQERLGIPPGHAVNEYGMTELGVQFYDLSLKDAVEGRSPRGWKSIPHWSRVCILNPETMTPAEKGAAGIIEVCDLSNRGSAIRILTYDLGRKVGDGFQVLGRAQGADARGCSLTLDEIMSHADDG